MLQLGFVGRGVSSGAIQEWSYKNEGTMCRDVLSIKNVTKYNPIPQ